MTLGERIAHHRKMAESYHAAYLKKTVEDGATCEEWKFAPTPMTVQQSATMEAPTYCITLPDWTILGFQCWPSDNGFVMQSHFGGHDRDGVLHDFYAYGFVLTNEKAEITHCKTHVSPEYNDFLDVVLGVHGPFRNGADEYMAAVARKMQSAGIPFPHQ